MLKCIYSNEFLGPNLRNFNLDYTDLLNIKLMLNLRMVKKCLNFPFIYKNSDDLVFS